MPDPAYYSGVIEGFYGRPWPQHRRTELLPRLADLGFVAYVYGPKDDIKVRARWREPYDEAESGRLRELADTGRACGLRIAYAIAPGLDMRYADATEHERLAAKTVQVLDLGIRDVVLLFDDIPHTMRDEDRAAFGSFAAAHAATARRLLAAVRERQPDTRFLICPTDYCTRMADARADGRSYLRTLAAGLPPDVDLLWTGDEIVSETIDAAAIDDVARTIGRPPVIWDNLHANDYDLRRRYLGPVAGRAAEVVAATRGFVTNPNTPFEVNEIAFRTLAAYLADPDDYRPLEAHEEALRAWRPAFGLDGGDTLSLEELRLLTHLHWLPWSCGPDVEAVLDDARTALADARDAGDPRLARVRSFAAGVERLLVRLTELRDRDLLYALYDVVWEARTEARALADVLDQRTDPDRARLPFGRPDGLANTYRRGFTAEVQALLPLDARGRVVPAAHGPVTIRPAAPDDRAGLYAVCLATGADGADATERFANPDLLGHRYVGPYLDLEPDLAFALVDDLGPAGYVLGAADTRAFYERFVRDWLPPLLRELGEPNQAPDTEDAKLFAELRTPSLTVPRDLAAYPAHLHIDLLPRAQGRGVGRTMIDALLRALERRNVPGVHLGVSPRNHRARRFYAKLGFRELDPEGPADDVVLMGRRLP